MNSQLDVMPSVIAALVAMASVAALSNGLSHVAYYSANPMPCQKR